MLRKLAVASLLILLNALPAWALSEYGFLLEPKNLSFSYYSLYPKSCAGFLAAKTALAENARSDFAFAKAAQASRDLQKAKAHAALQPKFLNKATLAAYRHHSTYCFLYGQKALREASEAAREGLSIIDSDAAKLELMIGPGFQGFAGGVVSELGEAKKNIEERNPLGKGFGSEFSKTIPLVNQTLSSGEMVKGVEALVGREGLWGKEIALDDRVLQAVFLLEREYQRLDEENQLLKIKVKLQRDFLEGEKIREIGENAFHLVGEAESVSSENSLESFESDFEKAVESDRMATEKSQQARADWNGKQEGYASRAIEKLAEANTRLKEEQRLFENAAERSESLEKTLKQKVLQEKTLAESMMERANSFSAAKARELLHETLDSQRISTRGERILYYVSAITQLKKAQEILSETPASQAFKFTLQTKLEELKELVSRAKKDAVFEAEGEKLKEIELSMENAGGEQGIFLEAQLDGLKEKVLAKLYERYSAIDGNYEKISSIAPHLGEGAHSRLLEIKSMFPFGKIDFEKAAGRLAGIEFRLYDLLSLAEAKTPEILKKHLQEQAKVGRDAELPVAGEKTRVRHSITMKNLLPLSTERQIKLDFEIPGGAVVLRKSPEMSIAKNVFLEKTEENAEYFLEYETLEKIVEIAKTQAKTVHSNSLEALVEEKILFTATRDTETLLVLEKQFPIEFARASGANAVFFTNGNLSQIRILAQAKKGENALEIEYAVPHPVRIEENFRLAGNLTEIEISVESKHVALENFNEEIAFEACDGGVSVSGSLKAKVKVLDGILAVEITGEKLGLFETKKTVVVLGCIAPQPGFRSLEESALQKNIDVGEEERIGAEIERLEKSCRECVEQAKKFLLLGDLQKAAEELEKAAIAASEKNEERRRLSEEFEEFGVLRDKALSAFSEFETAFSPSEENAKELQKNVLHQEGKKAKSEIEKLLKAVEKAETQSRLQALAERVQAKLEVLEEATAQQKQKAREEVSNAELKQRQFGTDETLSALNQAKEDEENGKAFTAWFAAKRLNSIFDSTEKNRGKENYNALLLGAGGALVLIALAAFFLRNKQEE
ncbi:MAG: hypothetical protein QXR53_01405 [Candidatus Norongarragalinales archaeon]